MWFNSLVNYCLFVCFSSVSGRFSLGGADESGNTTSLEDTSIAILDLDALQGTVRDLAAIVWLPLFSLLLLAIIINNKLGGTIPVHTFVCMLYCYVYMRKYY